MDRRAFLAGGAACYAALLADARAAGTSRAPRLRIRDVRAVRLRNGFNSRFVRVYTEEGLTGTGEFVDTMGAEYIINNNFHVMLKGRDPLEIQGILADFWGYHKINLGGPPSAVFVHGFGGPYLGAVSGVEMALWDLAGKALGLPIHRLMGGKMRDRVPVYLHAANPQIARRIVTETKTRTVKVGLDYSNDDWSINKGFEPGKRFGLHMTNNQIDDTVNFFAGFRKELGIDYEVALECHAHYDLEAGIQLCNLVEPYRPLFVEEPTTSDNVDSMVRLRNNTRVPIAAGENIYTRFGFRPYFEKQALSIIQPDFTKTGGLFEGLKIANMAETYNVPLAPHGVCTPLGTLGITHVCAVIPNLLVQEFTQYQEKAFTELCEPVKLDAEGFLPVPDAPGIGISLNEDAVKERLDPEFRML
ncbi:MAG TPA: mandelate racemase/muconate lactonizing enzyme family protein [Rhizomicrobium sp.]|nr:mandelate racemase/muconate lactonizing enzyme family protein [Rhizomicrobium sp.]